MSVINGKLMDRSVGVVETSQGSFSAAAAPPKAAGGPAGGHFVPSHRPLMEEPGPNEARWLDSIKRGEGGDGASNLSVILLM